MTKTYEENYNSSERRKRKLELKKDFYPRNQEKNCFLLREYKYSNLDNGNNSRLNKERNDENDQCKCYYCYLNYYEDRYSSFVQDGEQREIS